MYEDPTGYRNSSGAPDPTAYRAVARTQDEEAAMTACSTCGASSTRSPSTTACG